MDDSQINQIIKSLEDEVANIEKKSHIKSGQPPWDLFVTANRAACLEFARLFLKASLEPIDPTFRHSERVNCEASEMQILTDLNRKEFVIGGITRRKSWPEPNGIVEQLVYESRTRDKFAALGCGLAVILVLCLIGGGAAFWLMLLTGEIR